MNRHLAALAALWLAGGPSAVAAPAGLDPQVQARIAAAVEHDRRVFGNTTPVPGVLVGVWDGAGGSYAHAFGVADLAAKRPMTADDHFRIGSNTKTFVVTVILQLVDEGKLRLDDPISRFDLGVVVPDASHITVRQLCDMRSGLFEAYDTGQMNKIDLTPEMTFDPRTVIGWGVAHKPYFPPGRGYRYSNTNYLLLGQVIQSVTGRSVADEIRRRLLTRYHLDQTSYPDTQAMPEPYSHGYEPEGTDGWKDVTRMLPVSLTGAAGEMISDMADSRRWLALYVEGRTNSAASQRARLHCLPTGEGFGFGLGIGCSNGWFGYTGGLPGYNTANWMRPASGTAIVAWVNTQGNRPAPGVANSLVRDIARIVTPAHVPFAQVAASASPGTDGDQTAPSSGPATP